MTDMDRLLSTVRDGDVALDERATDPAEVGADSGGQSGDTQGLSTHADATDESVEELADEGQPYEAGIVLGMEDAADHPERSVHTHEGQGRSADIRGD